MAQKRSSSEAARVPAKRAKSLSEESLLDFIRGYGDIPKSCREMLLSGLPHCLAVADSERHPFHLTVLDHIACLLSAAEEQKRSVVNTIDKELSAMQVEKGKAFAEASNAKSEVARIHSDLNLKGKNIAEARKKCEGAAQAICEAVERQKAFILKKTDMLADQDNFRKFMADVWQPLKEDNLPGARRTRLVGQLTCKLVDLGARHLCDSMESLKNSEWRNGSFGRAAIESVDDRFTKHAAKLSQFSSRLDEEEIVHKSAIEAGEVTQREGQLSLDVLTKEQESMHAQKTELEKMAAEAVKVQQGVQSGIPPALRRLGRAREELEAFMELPALFSALKDRAAAVVEEPTLPSKGEDAKEPSKVPTVPTPVRQRVASSGSMPTAAADKGGLAREQPAPHEATAAKATLARENLAANEVKRIELIRRETFSSDTAWGLSVLNVTFRDIGTVQRSYRVLMAKLHPDRVQYTTAVARAMDKLKEAKDVCERCLSKKFAPGAPRKLSSTTLCKELGRRRYKLQWEPPRDTSSSAPVHRFVVAVQDPVHGPLKVAILEPEFNQDMGRFVTMQELGSYVLAEEELRKIKSLWRQSSAIVQVAAANDVGQSDWAVVQLSLGK